MKAFPYNSVLDEVTSTNEYAKVMGEEGAPHGTWIAARTQTGGRGRLGRVWQSHEGNLFISFVLRPEKNFPMTWVPLATALAVFETALMLKNFEGLALKWPNDLGFRDRKLGFRKIGGILCEGFGNPSGSYIVAGIGVNCAIAPETDQPTASLGVQVDDFREELVKRLPAVFTRNLEELRIDYERASLLRTGDSISWLDLRLPPGSPEEVGTFERYGDHGEILARAEGSSEIRKLYSEEVKLRLSR